MEQPTLIVMAAGIGSRFGGIKQLAAVGKHNELLLDYSLYDAKRAGFKRVVFVINRAIADDFEEAVLKRCRQYFCVECVYQEIDSCLPKGFIVPPERKKPWGTGHAVLCCRDVVQTPFAVINADDYYGIDAFASIYGALSGAQDSTHWYMVGYALLNTLTEHGHVSRGVCEVDEASMLQRITERTHIEKQPDGSAAYLLDGKFTPLPSHATASMNLWGFHPRVFDELSLHFSAFLDTACKTNPARAEYFLPTVVQAAIAANRARVFVLPSGARWYGVTYRPDLAIVQAAIERMTQEGIYPAPLWR